MKKKNNESAKNINPKPEDKNTKIVSSNPSTETVEENGMPFKKVLYGYSPEEVNAFISELRRTHETTLKLHEEKLAALKDNLALSIRERDYYIEKCKKQPPEPSKDIHPSEKKIAEYEAAISQLYKKLKAAEEENAFLKGKLKTDNGESSEAFIKKIAELEAQSSELEETLISVKKENAHLTGQLEKITASYHEQKALILQIEETKARLASFEKELKAKQKSVEEAEEKIIAVSAERDELRSKVSELEIRNDVMNQRLTEAEEEKSALKEANKKLIFESAEKSNSLEREYAGYKLAVQKELKLYSYYADRAEQTIAELTRQISNIKQSIEKTEL